MFARAFTKDMSNTDDLLNPLIQADDPIDEEDELVLSQQGFDDAPHEGDYYNLACLTAKKKTSLQFLEDCTYYVPLDELYNVESTCHYHQGMEYCPVLIKTQANVKEHFNQCNYLLQVWKFGGHKVYERQLQNKVTQWAVNNRYFVYKPAGEDEQSGYFHIVDLENQNATQVVEEFEIEASDTDPYTFITYNDSLLIVGNHSRLKVAYISHDLEPAQISKITPTTGTINIEQADGYRLHGLFVNRNGHTTPGDTILAIESPDNQIDFNMLIVNKDSIFSSGEVEYKLNQYVEIVPRMKTMQDPIVRFDTIVKRDEVVFSVAQRQSGGFDLYHNCIRVAESPEDRHIKGFDITFDTIYLDMLTYQPKPEVRAIHMIHENRVNLDNSETDPRFTMTNNYFQRIKNHCQIIRSFCLIKSFVVVAHGHLISIFNVVKEQWFDHLRLDADINHIFRQVTEDGEYKLSCLLVNGKIDTIGTHKEEDWTIEEESFQVVGVVKHTSHDREDSRWTMIMTEEEGVAHFYVLHDAVMHEITHLVPNASVKHSFSFLFTPAEATQLVIQDGTSLTIYELEDQKGEIQLKQVEETFQTKKLSGPIHAALIRQKKDGKWLMLFDHRNFYIIDLLTKEFKTIRNQNCIGMFFIDNNYMYGLCHKSHNRTSGFKLYDIMNVIQTGKDYSYPLSSVQVGCQGYIDYSHSNERLVFLSSYESIELVPILHRNTLSFIGMKKRSAYLAQRQFYDRFTTLEAKHSSLTTWNILTGKMRIDLNTNLKDLGYDYSDYEQYHWSEKDHVYREKWYNKILIRKKTPLKLVNGTLFAHLNQPGLKNQESYIGRVEKSFYQYKLIEITSETTIKEHLTFVHPFFNGKEQFLYFSEDTELMIERLDTDRVFLYRKQPAIDSINGVRWELVHRFQDFPSDLLENTQYPFIFTKDMTQFIDIDRKQKVFTIKDSITQEVKCVIPDYIMNAKRENPLQIANRFEWISNTSFRIVNKEGNERILLISADYSTITEQEFNFIPLYDKKECHKQHILLDETHYKIKEYEKRLVRRYQDYKSQYSLFNQTDRYSLYRAMFTVDYGVNNYQAPYVADLSFTFFHWNLIELMGKGKIQTDQIDTEHIQDLVMNILPGGDTIVHKFINRSDILENLYDICHPVVDDKRTIMYHIPFLRNLQGKSPFNLLEEKQDFRAMNMILEYLSIYEVDHHSKSLVDSLPTCVEHSLPNFNDYLDSRLLQTSHSKKITKGVLNGDEPVVAASFWIDPTDTKNLYKKAPIEQDIKLQFIDVPKLHSFNEEISDAFFEQLADTEDMTIFERKAVQKLIEFKWPLVLEFTLRKLFVPYIIFLILYNVYIGWVFEVRDDSAAHMVLNYVSQGILLAFTAYFLFLEFRQFINQGFAYLTSFWNYLDVLPPALVTLFIIFEIFGMFDYKSVEEDIENINDPEADAKNYKELHRIKTIQAVFAATCSLMLWLKTLYFLRIFQKTGYLIRIIIEVVVDMRHFLFILILSIIAFGDAMLQLSKANPAMIDGEEVDQQFVGGGFIVAIIYVYRMVLGDWDTSNFGTIATPYVMVLFLLCTIFNLVIMLNLLIAIISESFAKINEVSEQASYQEKASMIHENSYLIPQGRSEAFCPPNKYLLVATDIAEEFAEQGNDIDVKLKVLKKKLYNHMNVVEKNLTQRLEESNKAIGEVKAENVKVVKLLTQVKDKLE